MKNPDYSHGPLIPLISLYMIYKKREVIKTITKEGSNYGLLLLILSMLIQLIAIRGEIGFLSSYSMILTLVGVVLYLFGKQLLSQILFPIIYLLFMIPFWGMITNVISNYLKILSSIFITFLLRMFDFPVFRSGVLIQLSNGTLEVADPCSGIRSLFALIALGSAIAYFSDESIYKKILLVFIGIPLAFMANTLRVVFFGIMLEKKGMLIEDGFLHSFTGVVVFSFAFIGLLIFNKWVKIK